MAPRNSSPTFLRTVVRAYLVFPIFCVWFCVVLFFRVLFVCLFVCCACLFVCLFFCLFVCLFVCFKRLLFLYIRSAFDFLFFLCLFYACKFCCFSIYVARLIFCYFFVCSMLVSFSFRELLVFISYCFSRVSFRHWRFGGVGGARKRTPRGTGGFSLGAASTRACFRETADGLIACLYPIITVVLFLSRFYVFLSFLFCPGCACYAP